MLNNLMALTFLDDPEEELRRISHELGLSQAIKLLETGATKTEGLTTNEAMDILEIVQQVEEIFDVSVPKDNNDIVQSLASIARQYHWSKLLREKALVSLFRFIHMKMADSGIPLVATLVHPDTGTPFDETSFTIWFCKQASITAATTFQRMAAYRKMLGLGYELEEAFKLVITKPYLIQDTLNQLATFDSAGRIISVNPDVVSSVSKNIGSDNQDIINSLIEKVEENNSPSNRANLINAFTPVIKRVIEEVAAHPNPKDASIFISSDLLGKPGIFYTMEAGGVLVVTVVVKIISDNGADSSENVYRIPFVPKTNEGVPIAVIEDMLNRLPIRNRREAEGFLYKQEELEGSPF